MAAWGSDGRRQEEPRDEQRLGERRAGSVCPRRGATEPRPSRRSPVSRPAHPHRLAAPPALPAEGCPALNDVISGWVSVTCQIRQLEQPICSKPDKRTRSPLRHERLVEDVRSGSRPGEKHYCRVPHFTSSDIFNKNIRIHAVEMGFAISVALSHPLGVTGTCRRCWEGPSSGA